MLTIKVPQMAVFDLNLPVTLFLNSLLHDSYMILVMSAGSYVAVISHSVTN